MKGEDPLSVLVPSLRDHNVKTIANLSSDIPIKVTTITAYVPVLID